jgi:hypothetical protein
MVLCFVLLSFSLTDPLDEQAVYLQEKLTGHYNMVPEAQRVKKYELHVTNTGFCRYKRFFNSGKVEYFSFNLIKFRDVDYSGSTASGTLYLRTKGDDVIVQTYNDSKGGDIDSMSTYMAIPLKDVEAADLNEFAEKFQQMSSQLHR